NAGMYRLLGGAPVALSLARFVAAALLLLVPTTLMGATLPILARHFVTPEGRSPISATVGKLYSINTFRAVVGTFVGGFMRLPAAGVRATTYAAAATTLALAAAVLLARRRLRAAAAAPTTDDILDVPIVDEPAAPEPPVVTFAATPLQRGIALAAFALS